MMFELFTNSKNFDSLNDSINVDFHKSCIPNVILDDECPPNFGYGDDECVPDCPCEPEDDDD